MCDDTLDPARRGLLAWAAGTATLGLAAAPAWAQTQTPAPAGAGTPVPAMTEGPFYPSERWRLAQQPADWDADLTQVRDGGRVVGTAQGEHLDLQLALLDAQGRAIDGVRTEIWQCDALAVYRHPSQPQAASARDANFQGHGEARSDRAGQVRFRTIRPVPYPGRTPHIHFKLRHPAFGELTSQLFVAGDPGNAGDWLWRRLGAAGQAAVTLRLQPAAEDGLRWRAVQALRLGA